MTFAERREKIENKIFRLEDKLIAAKEEREALQAECVHEGVEWKQTTCSNIEDFSCEICGKYENRVRSFQLATN